MITIVAYLQNVEGNQIQRIGGFSQNSFKILKNIH